MRENFHQMHFSSIPVFASASASSSAGVGVSVSVFASASASIYPLEPHACKSHFSYLKVVASSGGRMWRPFLQLPYKRGALTLLHSLWASPRTPVGPPNGDASSKALSFYSCTLFFLSRSLYFPLGKLNSMSPLEHDLPGGFRTRLYAKEWNIR